MTLVMYERRSLTRLRPSQRLDTNTMFSQRTVRDVIYSLKFTFVSIIFHSPLLSGRPTERTFGIQGDKAEEKCLVSKSAADEPVRRDSRSSEHNPECLLLTHSTSGSHVIFYLSPSSLVGLMQTALSLKGGLKPTFQIETFSM